MNTNYCTRFTFVKYVTLPYEKIRLWRRHFYGRILWLNIYIFWIVWTIFVTSWLTVIVKLNIHKDNLKAYFKNWTGNKMKTQFLCWTFILCWKILSFSFFGNFVSGIQTPGIFARGIRNPGLWNLKYSSRIPLISYPDLPRPV